MNKNKKELTDKKWVLTITLIAFVISMCLSFLSEMIIPNVFIGVSVFLVLLFIFIGVIFDIIGVAVATSEDKMFHSMAARKVKGAKQGISFINKKDKVSSFCNDVIGDICGVISGSCGLAIAIKLSSILSINAVLSTILVTSIISALTIGGKAIGKSFAVNKSNEIVFEFSKIISIFTKK